MFNTYEQYQDAQSSEKITLAIITPAKRLIGWVLHSGFIYKLENFDFSVIESVQDLGVDLIEVASIGLVAAGKFYNDRTNKILYLQTSDSAQPNSKFLVMHFKQFYSSMPISLPYDLNTGKEVDWLPYILSTSEFGLEIDNKNQLGFAIEGSGSINLLNNQEYWKPIFDKWTWENKRIEIYSYSRSLPVTESKIIYRGFIQKKSWSETKIGFTIKDIINELKQEIELDNLGDYPSVSIPENLKLAKQRMVYGYVNGHIPSPLDNIVTGFSGTGTLEVNFGSDLIIGTGTSFLSDLSPNDKLIIQGDTEEYSIKSIQSDTQLTLTEAWNEATRTGRTYVIKPSRSKKYKNRKHLIAGHATKEPVKTVLAAVSLNYLILSDYDDLRVGDKLKIGQEYVKIRRITSNGVKLLTSLVTLPAIGSTVTRLSLGDVYIDGDRVDEDDYIYDANTAVLEFNELAEFNISRSEALIGTSITITNTLRTVTGVGTKFTTQLESGDWIKTSNQEEYFEILQVIDDTNLELRVPATYTSTQTGVFKSPKYLQDSGTTVSCDLIGKTEDGTKTGVFIKTASAIIKDVLDQVGLSNYINTASFNLSEELAPQILGRVLPVNMSDKKTQTAREFIGDISESVFGSVIQTPDFEIAFNILEPTRDESNKKFDESDTLDFNINTDSSKSAKSVKINYLYKEFDYLALSQSNQQTESTPDANVYLVESSKVDIFDSKLLLEADAKTMSERYAFMLQNSRATVTLQTKLQASRMSVNDRAWLSHEKLYERIGTSINQKIGAIESVRKSGTNSVIEIEDLSGSFSRCSTVTENTADIYDDSDDAELIINGFITDNYGMIDNMESTFGVNLIW